MAFENVLGHVNNLIKLSCIASYFLHEKVIVLL